MQPSIRASRKSFQTNHAKLDILGAKIRKVLAQKFNSFNFKFPKSQTLIELGVINYSFPMPVADVYLSVDSKPFEVLTREIVKEFHCEDSGDTFVGYEVTNGHWSLVPSGYNQSKGINFSAWVRLFCSKTAQSNAIIGVELLNMTLHISETGKLTSIEIIEMQKLK